LHVDAADDRPACAQIEPESPTAGIWRARRALASSFSAHRSASTRSDWRCALRVSDIVACEPAASASATMPSAISTSINVKPRLRALREVRR
jgi:hypothetical protein